MKTLMAIAIAALAALSLHQVQAQAVPDFEHKMPIPKLSTPVDFRRTVYAEASKTVSIGFWSEFDRQSPAHPNRFFRVSGNSNDFKTTYKIVCDFNEHTATVTANYIDVNGDPEESLEAYKITDLGGLSVCLMRVQDNGAVEVITMSSEVGSFMKTDTHAPGAIKYQEALTWYGTCRN